MKHNKQNAAFDAGKLKKQKKARKTHAQKKAARNAQKNIVLNIRMRMLPRLHVHSALVEQPSTNGGRLDFSENSV